MLSFFPIIVVLSFPFFVTAINNTTSPFKCKCAPTDVCWPSINTWNAFNTSLSGKLLKPAPEAIVCYPGPQQNLQACNNIAVELTNETFVGNDPIALAYPPDDPCPAVYTTNVSTGGCVIGDRPRYVVNASTIDDVVSGVNFAREKNIRLVIRDSGHDLLGRSTGYGSLEIWIRYLRQGVVFADSFQEANGCPKSTWQGGSVTINGGYVWGDIEEAAAQRNVVVATGSDPTIGSIGGWPQGGGHGPACRNYGLGADQLLSATVVLASGEVVTANPCQNPDLFFAIRGGGGGTYGLVLSTTVKTHPSPPISSQDLAMAPLDSTQIPVFMDALALIYAAFPDLNDGGLSGYGEWAVESYAPVVGNFTTGYVHSLGAFNQSISEIQELLAPFMETLQQYNESLFITTTYQSFPNYVAYHSVSSGGSSVGVGTFAGGSRLLGRKALTSSFSDLQEMLNVTAGSPGQFTFTNVCIVGGGQVFKDAEDPYSGVNPAWRVSYVHNIVDRAWAAGSDAAIIESIRNDMTYTKVAAMKKLAPDTGSYMNEADKFDPDYLQDFYGEHLERLEAIKEEYDPESVFYCPTCVGSEKWAEDESGRLCQVA